MGSFKLITSFLMTYLITVNCGPINKRQIASDCGSTHHAPLPTIIAGRAALSSIPLRYAEPIPIPTGSEPFGAFNYEFTVPVPPSPPHSFPMARAGDCSHTTFVAPPETAHLPAAPLPPPPPPPPAAPILTDCYEAPTLTQFAPIAALPPPPPPPPAQLPPPTPVHTEPCFETAPAAPILTAPEPIYTEPAEAPLPPPSHIITEPLKSPGCFETAPAPTFISAPQPPQAIELAPPPPPPPHFESPTLGGQISALDCHGAAPVTTSFVYPPQPLGSYYYGDATHAGEEQEGFPEILDAKSLHTGFGGRTGISHPFFRLAKTAKY